MKQGLVLSCRAVIAVATASLACGLGGCGDEGTSDFTLSLTVDDTTLTADGTDSATIRVTVLDDRGYPPPIGSSVLVRAENGAVNGTESATGEGLTDAAGTAQFTVSCTSESDVQVMAIYDGDFSGFLFERITCAPAPEGDWEVLISASPRSVVPSGTSTVTVDAVTGDDAPVPQGTAITCSINEPNPGAQFRTGARTEQTLFTPDASGRLSTVVIAPSTNDNFTVCCGFADPRFGPGRRCLTIQVGTNPIDEATCLGTYAPSRISGDGESTSVLTLSVFDDNGQAVDGATIEAFIELGDFEDPEEPDVLVGDVVLTTDGGGVAEVTVVAPAATGTADVEATAEFAGLDEPLECIFQESLVYFPPPTCEFDPIGVLDLGVSRSVRACYTDFDAPVPAGRRVDFDLVSAVGGTTLTATTAFTDEDGCASTGIATGSAPGGFTIEARMPFGRTSATCQSQAQIQRGGLESANQMVVSCGYRNLGVYVASSLGDPAFADVVSACGMLCQANVADQFHNPVEGATVYFTTETGTIEAVATTNAAGIASSAFLPRGARPRDVPPTGSEASGPAGAPYNVRDSIVTIMASTVGQEMFNDDDGDGVYDEGEFFIDLPEPFVDANDNDVFDEGGSHESFTDVAVPGRALNGVWDGANGQWDAYTQIWATTHVTYSGRARAEWDVDLFWDGPMVPDPLRPGVMIPSAPGTLRFEPIDDFGAGMSSATDFVISSTCDRAEVTSYKRTGDIWQTTWVGRVLRYFLAGAEVPLDAAAADYGLFGTSFVFGMTGPSIAVSVGAPDEGDAEVCGIKLTYTEGVNADCSDTLLSNEFEIPVLLPESF